MPACQKSNDISLVLPYFYCHPLKSIHCFSEVVSRFFSQALAVATGRCQWSLQTTTKMESLYRARTDLRENGSVLRRHGAMLPIPIPTLLTSRPHHLPQPLSAERTEDVPSCTHTVLNTKTLTPCLTHTTIFNLQLLSAHPSFTSKHSQVGLVPLPGRPQRSAGQDRGDKTLLCLRQTSSPR